MSIHFQQANHTGFFIKSEIKYARQTLKVHRLPSFPVPDRFVGNPCGFPAKGTGMMPVPRTPYVGTIWRSERGHSSAL
nr:MAG TPA: hypothetical protein [Caudoviricetes sp.]